jgi:hypothetical protein
MAAGICIAIARSVSGIQRFTEPGRERFPDTGEQEKSRDRYVGDPGFARRDTHTQSC